MMNSDVNFCCGTADHEKEAASFYCLEQQCEASRLYCALCLDSIHKNHKNRPVKFFWNQIHRDLTAIENSIGALAKIDALKQEIMALFSLIPDDQIQSLLRVSIQQYFMKVDDLCRCKHVHEIHKSLQQHSVRSNMTRIKDLFKVYCTQWQKNNEEQQSSLPNFNKLLRILITNMRQKYQAGKQAVSKGEIGLNLISIFSEETTAKKFVFNPKMMHSGLTFIDKNKVKILNYADYSYFALCQPQLSMNKIQTISFRLVNLSSYVTLGICKKNKIQNNYEFISSGLGHGSYQVSYDGYTWSDTDSSINQQYSGWYYNQGDTVTVQFNPKSKKLKFTRNIDSTSPSSHQMPFDCQKGDKLHFCVTMNSEPEEVEIIS